MSVAQPFEVDPARVAAQLTPLADAGPSNVIEALAAIRRDLPGIGKDQQASAQQGGYAYRGIEAITAAAGPLMGRYGVVFAPEVVEERTVDVIVGGKPWTDTRLKVLYRVYGPGGIDDCLTIGPLLTIGRDNSDKGANKAMTQAYKVALLQVLCIGDSKDDGDQASHEADAPDPEADARRLGWADAATMKAEHDDYIAAARALTPDQQAAVKAEKTKLGFGWPLTPEQMETMGRVLAEVAPAQPDDGRPFEEAVHG